MFTKSSKKEEREEQFCPCSMRPKLTDIKVKVITLKENYRPLTNIEKNSYEYRCENPQ